MLFVQHHPSAKVGMRSICYNLILNTAGIVCCGLQVWLAECIPLHTQVAIKLMDLENFGANLVSFCDVVSPVILCLQVCAWPCLDSACMARISLLVGVHW